MQKQYENSIPKKSAVTGFYAAVSENIKFEPYCCGCNANPQNFLAKNFAGSNFVPPKAKTE